MLTRFGLTQHDGGPPDQPCSGLGAEACPDGGEDAQGAEARPPSSGSCEASGSGLGAETRPAGAISSPALQSPMTGGGGNAPIGIDTLREALANASGGFESEGIHFAAAE